MFPILNPPPIKINEFILKKKSYDKPRNSILKNRDITLPTNICLVKAMAFPVVTYGCESWIIKKAEPPPRKAVTGNWEWGQ